MVLFAKVKAGHDKNHIYMIKESNEKQISLVNGTTKTMDHPKKKNLIHIQVIKKLPDSVQKILEEHEEMITDEVIAEALKEYNS